MRTLFPIPRPRLSANGFLLAATAVIVLVDNASFWSLAGHVLPADGAARAAGFAAIGVLLGAITLQLLALFSWRGVLKPATLVILMLCATAAYSWMATAR